MKSSRRLSTKGFMMVEAMIVASIFSIVGVGIASSFISGMKIWDRARNVDFGRSNAILQLEIIAKELRQSANIPLVSFEGESQKISFAAVVGNSIFKISYEFDPFTNTLLQKRTAFKNVINEEEEQGYRGRKVLSMENFSLSYFYFNQSEGEYGWKDTWEEEGEPLKAVKINIKVAGEEITKTVFIYNYD